MDKGGILKAGYLRYSDSVQGGLESRLKKLISSRRRKNVSQEMEETDRR